MDPLNSVSSFTDFSDFGDFVSFLNEDSDQEANLNCQINESLYFDIDSLITRLGELSNYFTVLSLNIQSIRAKWDLFSATLDCLFEKNISPCAILLQETWLDFDSNLYDLCNYHLFSLPPTCSQHGGLVTYIRNDFNGKVADIYQRSDIWEGLFIETKNIRTGKKVFVSNVYRPPRDNNSISNISAFIEDISSCLNNSTRRIT